jgi:hypothetical protein
MSSGTEMDSFTELAVFAVGGEEQHETSSRRNVLKRGQFIRRGVEEVSVDQKGPDDPLVFVQREGDHVTGIDFLCKCGRSASLRLEYDEE